MALHDEINKKIQLKEANIWRNSTIALIDLKHNRRNWPHQKKYLKIVYKEEENIIFIYSTT